MVRFGMHLEVSHIFRKTQPNQSRYLPLAKCLTEIAKMSPKGASDLINSKVGAEVIDEAKLINY